MFHVNRYRMLEVRRAMRRKRIFRDRTNPLEIYDDLELIERFRYNETSFFCGSTYIVPFFCISLMSLFTEFPAFTMFAISCHALFLSPEVIDEENFAFKITSLFVLFQQYNFFSICPIWLPFRHFLFSTVTNSNIQTHPTLNVYPTK